MLDDVELSPALEHLGLDGTTHLAEIVEHSGHGVLVSETDSRSRQGDDDDLVAPGDELDTHEGSQGKLRGRGRARSRHYEFMNAEKSSQQLMPSSPEHSEVSDREAPQTDVACSPRVAA